MPASAGMTGKREYFRRTRIVSAKRLSWQRFQIRGDCGLTLKNNMFVLFQDRLTYFMLVRVLSGRQTVGKAANERLGMNALRT